MSVFADEWRACLREHFMDVVRNRDRSTEKSLISVMHEVGFSESELAELRVRATMHVDDAPEDFVPDLEVLEVEEATIHAVAQPDEASDVQEEERVEAEVVEESLEAEEVEADDIPEEEDGPQQLSLF